MKKKPLILLVVLVVVAGLLWSVLTGDPGRRPAEGPVASAPTAAGEGARAQPAPVVAPQEAAAEVARTVVDERESATVAGFGEAQSFALDGARWVDVRVVLPPGVPPSDEPYLLAFSSTDEELGQWQLRRLGRAVGLDDSFTDELDEEGWARRELGGDGRARVPFAADAKTGALVLVSRYVYAPTTLVDLASEEPVTLECELGAYVTGRLLVPVGAEERRLSPEDFELEFEGRGEQGIFAGGMTDSRSPELADDLAFELRALPASNRYFVRVEADKLVDFVELSFQVDPGEHRVYDIPLELGASVSGFVVTANGDPIADADVTGQGRGGLLARMSGGDEDALTDAAGAFTLWGLPAGGEVRIVAQADGYLPVEEEFEVADGVHLTDVRLVLQRGAEISGRVEWPDGSPAVAADVVASKRERGGWNNEEAETTADDQGEFVLSGLGEGPYEVIATFGPAGEQWQALQTLDALGYVEEHEHDPGAPPADDRRGRAIVGGVAGDTHGLVLVLEPPVAVVGRVVDDLGEPVDDFRIVANPAGASFWENTVNEAFSDTGGTFELDGVYPGDWTVKAEAGGYSPGEEAEAAITVPANAAVVLTLNRSITVTGIVVDPLGQPVAGAQVSAGSGETGPMRWRLGSQSAESDEQGRFELTDCPPTGMALTADSEGWAPSLPVPVDAAPGEALTEVVVALRQGVTVTGEVYDEAGEPDAGVQVTAGANNFGFGGGEDAGTQTDAAGRFVIEHVTPGKITVVAMPSEEEIFESLADAESEEDMIPGFLSQMRMQTVEAGDGEEVHVVLGSEPKVPVRVTGVVTDDGEPVPDTAVVAIEEGGAMLTGMKLGRTDASGRYELVVDRPGDFVFSVGQQLFGGGESQAPFFVSIPEVGEYRLDLELPLGSIAGRVVGPDGGPVEGVGVHLSQAGGVMSLLDFDQSRRVVTDAQGSFRFTRLAAGTYSVHVGGGSFFVEDSKHYGAAVLEGVTLDPDETNDGLEIRLSRAGKLTGTVTDETGRPISGASVFVRGESGHVLSNISSVQTDGTGRFVHEGVPPEAVTVFARKGDLTSLEAGPLEVSSDSERSVQLTLRQGTYLVVSLLDGDQPVRARVEVLDQDGAQWNGLMTQESLESFFTEGFSSRERRVGPLPPGKYTLRAVAQDGKDARKSVTVREGQQERRVKLRLK